ncbi:MAG: hypothetical protein ACR2I0_09955 [Rhodoferax sp.]
MFESLDAMAISKKILVVVLTGTLYYIFCKLNEALFAAVGYATGVAWIFLPSGLRLAFTLVFVLDGALGIALASTLISTQYWPQEQFLSNAITGCISGFAPLLARKLCADYFKLGVNLTGLTGQVLLKVACVYALLSAALHQVWFSYIGRSQQFLQNTAVMAFGDLVGTVVMLYVSKFLIDRFFSKADEDFSGNS